MIRIENLHKRFGEVRAVDGVSFGAADGQVTGLLGPNGAGKTTTLRMLYTLMRPDEGQILVDGIDAVVDPQGARFALGVLPDQSGLYPRLTAREHIEYFGELQGVTGADLRSRTDHLLKMLDMTAIADRRVAGFSHGERTKTALARAIVHNPKNVLLDEPTNGLDVMSTRAVREIIRRLKERRPHGALLQPRDAGSLGALRHDCRDRARARSSARDRRTICGGRPGRRISRMRLWR